jgi:antitoxin CptB
MIEATETKRKRLIMRSMRRGIKEMDLILTDFAARRLDGFDADQLDEYQSLLDESDLDLYSWIAGQSQSPARYADLIADLAEGAKGLTRPVG